MLAHPDLFSPLKLPRKARDSSWEPRFCSKAIRNCQLPTKKTDWAREDLAWRGVAWRGTMSFSLSSHKTDFERPHCLTLPVFVRRPLCRERRRRRRTQKVRLRDVQSKWNGPRRGGGGRERERAELTPCGGRVIKSSVSCRRWKSPPAPEDRPTDRTDRPSNRAATKIR